MVFGEIRSNCLPYGIRKIQDKKSYYEFFQREYGALIFGKTLQGVTQYKNLDFASKSFAEISHISLQKNNLPKVQKNYSTAIFLLLHP